LNNSYRSAFLRTPCIDQIIQAMQLYVELTMSGIGLEPPTELTALYL